MGGVRTGDQDVSTGKRCPHQVPPPGAAWFDWSCGLCNDVGTRMRALSLHDPYPHLILDLPDEHHKNIENRQRKVLSTTGPLLIHVSRASSEQWHDSALKVAREAGVPEELLPPYRGRDLGGIVGCVLISDVLPKRSLADLAYRWKFLEHVGYVLSKRAKLPFRAVSAGQGVFHVDLTSAEREAIVASGIL